MTAVTLAGNAPVAQASMTACKLVPLPLINTISRPDPDGLANDNALIAFDDFAEHKDFFSKFF